MRDLTKNRADIVEPYQSVQDFQRMLEEEGFEPVGHFATASAKALPPGQMVTANQFLVYASREGFVVGFETLPPSEARSAIRVDDPRGTCCRENTRAIHDLLVTGNQDVCDSFSGLYNMKAVLSALRDSKPMEKPRHFKKFSSFKSGADFQHLMRENAAGPNRHVTQVTADFMQLAEERFEKMPDWVKTMLDHSVAAPIAHPQKRLQR